MCIRDRDNGKITWYNLDLPETIAIRNQIFEESGRVSTIGISALDPAWLSLIHIYMDDATEYLEHLKNEWDEVSPEIKTGSPVIDVIFQMFQVF